MLAFIFVQRHTKILTLLKIHPLNQEPLKLWPEAPFSDIYVLLTSFTGNNDKLVCLLVEHPQLNVNLRGLDGYTALIRAAGERADYVAMLLSHPNIDPNLATYFGTTALTNAIR